LELEPLENRCIPSATSVGNIVSNFNGTPIAAGNTLWFSSAFKVSGLPNAPVNLAFTNETITFAANGQTYTLAVPDAHVLLSPTATSATTTFDASTNSWETVLPMKFSGNAFLSAVSFPVTNPLPGGINPVTWQGQFSSDTAGVSVNWQWAAANYKTFSSDYNALNVKPTDDNHVSAYQNSDHAGTPEAYRAFVTGGARGGGGSNFTGSLSGTQTVTPAQLASLSGFVTDTAGNPLFGVTLVLSTTNSAGDTVTVQATTDSNGFFIFTGLQADLYMVTVLPPSGYQNAGEQVGTVNGQSDGTDLGNGQLGNIDLVGGNNGINYDFQEQRPVIDV
jgi:hypothetical protein